MIKFPKLQDFQYVSEFQHWFASIENQWVDVLIPNEYAEIFPEQQFDFLKLAEPLVTDLVQFGEQYIQQFSALDLSNGELNSIRYHAFNHISCIELCYIFEQDPNFLWSVAFEQNPQKGGRLDVGCSSLDYGYNAIILHREPI